jgi:hypothetical protein
MKSKSKHQKQSQDRLGFISGLKNVIAERAKLSDLTKRLVCSLGSHFLLRVFLMNLLAHPDPASVPCL